MKKAVKIIVMIFVAAVLFLGALWIPSFVNTLTESRKIGQKVAMEDKMENREDSDLFNLAANEFFISGEKCFTDTGIRRSFF